MVRPLRAAVVGAGMSGLFVSYHLKQAGMDFTVYEKHDGAGGTWHANTYPGLNVDVLTRNYEFPFARRYDWSLRYAPGSEVRRYLVEFSQDQGIEEHVRYETEVTNAVWHDEGYWQVDASDGTSERYDILIVATGFLRLPRIPRVAGFDTFEGKSFHSSEWDHSIDLEDKSIRYAVVGTGSSGVQITTALGERGLDTRQFIRNPQWMQVKQNPPYTHWEKLVFRIPVLAKRYDENMALLRSKTDGNETWRLVPGPDRDEMRRRFQEMLAEEIPDPELREKFTPKEPLGVKRIAKTANYYKVVQQDNVTPVFAGIERIEPKGIVDDKGEFHEVDVIVWATGFDAHAYMRPMAVTGAGGLDINDAWENGVEAFKALSVPKFPNMFLLCGPFAPVNSIAIPRTLEHEVGYLMQLLEQVDAQGTSFAATPEATERFLDEIREALPGTTYAEGDNWYSQKVGTPIIYPFTRARHESDYREVDLADYERFPLERGSANGSVANAMNRAEAVS